MTNKAKFFIYSFLLTLLFTYFAIGVYQHAGTWYFQDETEHTTLGWMISQHHQQLYTDLSTNHQPLPILFAAIWFKIIPTTTLYQLILKLRFSLFAVYIITSIYASYRFKLKGILSSAFLLAISYYYFGFHLLGESLTAPAILILTLHLIELLKPKTNHQSKYDPIVIVLVSFISVFSLLPSTPFVLLTSFYFLIRFNKIKRIYFIGTGIFCLLVLSIFINPMHWFQETIINNYLYFIPFTSLTFSEQLQAYLYGFIQIFHPTNQTSIFFSLTSIFIITTIIKNYTKNKHLTISLLILFTLIGLLNNRTFTQSVQFFEGFHLFPYLAAWIAFTFSIFEFFYTSSKSRIVTLLLFSLLFIYLTSWVRVSLPREQNYHEQYGPEQRYAELLSKLKTSDSRLLTGPNGRGYINIMANLPLSDRQNFHLPWSYRVPYLREDFEHMIQTNPPEFILFDKSDDPYSQYLTPILNTSYYHATPSAQPHSTLYIRNDIYSNLTPVQPLDIQ